MFFSDIEKNIKPRIPNIKHRKTNIELRFRGIQQSTRNRKMIEVLPSEIWLREGLKGSLKRRNISFECGFAVR